MKLAIVSDLHLEHAAFAPPQGALDGVDVVVLAGDTMSNTRKLPAWASRPSVFGPDRTVIAILGNHEFYGGQLQARRRELQEAAVEFDNVHVLDPGEVFLDHGRVRVIGATLWTDFALSVGLAGGREHAMAAAERGLNDYELIRIEDQDGRRSLRAADTLALHRQDRAWLLAKLQQPFAGVTVVATHHAPSAGSVAPRYAADPLTPAFVSDLGGEFFDVPALWIHGHTHTSFDYVRGNTRVISNPRGYRLRDSSFENAAFNPALVVDV